MMKYTRSVIGLAVLAVVLFVAIAGYFYSSGYLRIQPADHVRSMDDTGTKKSSYSTTEAEMMHAESDDEAAMTADIQPLSTNGVKCSDRGCFDLKFSSCEPATINIDIGLAAITYTIIGPAENGCTLISMYTRNVNIEWANKPMTCTFDNSLSFDKAVESVFKATIDGESDCSGPLVDVLRNL